MPSLTTAAVVLHAFDYLETSRIVRLATRDAGIVSVIARGARRSTRRFGAALDLFAGGIADVQLRTGRDLQQLLAFEVTNARSELANDLDRFGSASMLAELAMRCGTGEEEGQLFETLSAALDRLCLASATRARLMGLGAGWQLSAALGFSPALDQCAQCHAALDPAEGTAFSPQVGGALCAPCGRSLPGLRRVPPDARSALRTWLSGDEDVVADAQSQRAHARLLGEFVACHLADHAELKAFRAWTRRFAGSGT